MISHSLQLVAPAAAPAASPEPAVERAVSKPKSRRNAVIEFIRSAERSLLLSIFRCDDLGVLHELGEAVARGVRVEVLVTGRAKGWARRLGPMAGCLARMGVVVHRFAGSASGMKYHAKYAVADDRAALAGTFNLTRKCFRKTRDFLLVTRDAGIVAGLAALFRADALGGTIQSGGGRLIVGPDHSRERIESLLAGARYSIRILDHKLSDPGILAILRDRRRNGVEVTIQRGAMAGALTPHGRLIVVDRAIAIFGSFALSQKSLDARRELAVAIDDPQLVAKLDRQFDKASAGTGAIEAAA